MAGKVRQSPIPEDWRRVSWVACLARVHALQQAGDDLWGALPGGEPSVAALQSAAASGVPQQIWGLAWLRYACLCPVIDGWRALVRADSAQYADSDIEHLLESPMRAILYRFRDSVLHFTAVNDERVISMVAVHSDFAPWAEELHQRFVELHRRTRPRPGAA